MATGTPTNLAQSALAGTVGTLYTVPSATYTIVKEILLCNTDSLAVSVNVYFVPSAGTAGVSNQIISGLSLQPGETFVLNLSTTLATGATIQADAGTASVVAATISGVQVA